MTHFRKYPFLFSSKYWFERNSLTVRLSQYNGIYYGTYGKIKRYLLASWKQWVNTTCTVTCGGGTKTSDRHCQHGTVGQIGCEGEEHDEQICNTQLCRE